MAVGTVITLEGLDKKALLKIYRVLQQPQRVLKQIGAVVLADAQRAFKDQGLGELKWPARYPKQQPPFVNIAGVVSDFLSGRKKPPARRFDSRPANIDTAQTLRGLTPARAVTTSGYVVTVRSATPQSFRMQNGGTSRQPVTQAVKDSLNEWMKQERRAFKRIVKRAGGQGGYVTQTKRAPKKKGSLWQRLMGGRVQGTRFKSVSVKKAAERFGAVQKLGFLFQRKSLTTRVGKRPFLGITPEGKRKMLAIVSGEFLPPGIRGRVTP